MGAWAIACVFLAGSSVVQQEPAATSLEFRVDPLIDLHSWVRKLASEQGELPELEGLEPAVAFVRELDRELGHPLAWGPLEGALEGRENAGAAAEAFESLPESFTLFGGKTIALRERAVGLARALAGAEPGFREGIWPEHERAVRGKLEELERDLVPKEAQCLEFLMRGLGMDDPRVAIPVVLVAEAPWPGGVTHRRHGGGGICFVGLNAAEGSPFLETILHEATHALEVSTASQKTVLADLRERLIAAGIGESDRALRDVPHTLMFVHAAATVRRILDPKHVPYGDAGYYSKVAPVGEIEVPLWNEHLDGKRSRDETLEAIVRGVLDSRAAAPAAK